MNADTDTEMRQLTFASPQVLDDEIDDTWQRRGFASKSAFVRHALRAAVGPGDLSDETRAIIEATGGELERGETISRADFKSEFIDG